MCGGDSVLARGKPTARGRNDTSPPPPEGSGPNTETKQMYVHKDGTAMTFSEVVRALLIEEHGRTEEDADRLLTRFPEVMAAAMAGRGQEYRAAAMALEMAELHEAGGTEAPRGA